MSKSVPPPVTRKSSKKHLWEELECARAEIEQQQLALNELRECVSSIDAEAASLRYRFRVILAAMGNIK